MTCKQLVFSSICNLAIKTYGNYSLEHLNTLIMNAQRHALNNPLIEPLIVPMTQTPENTVALTDNAAKRVAQILEKEVDGSMLRVSVEGGAAPAFNTNTISSKSRKQMTSSLPNLERLFWSIPFPCNIWRDLRSTSSQISWASPSRSPTRKQQLAADVEQVSPSNLQRAGGTGITLRGSSPRKQNHATIPRSFQTNAPFHATSFCMKVSGRYPLTLSQLSSSKLMSHRLLNGKAE